MKTKPFILMRLLLIFTAGAIIPLSCGDDDKGGKVPVVKTKEISGITSYTAFCSGEVADEGDMSVTDRGICWSKTSNVPSINDKKRSLGEGSGSYSGQIKLEENTTFYISAYATSSAGTAYGDVVTITTMPAVSDISGNKYSTVKIGNQIWMAENLKTPKYSNGDPIDFVTGTGIWGNLKTGACCDYNNDPDVAQVYGKLYNWYAAQDYRNVCMSGWHVPSSSEWEIMLNSLGGADKAGPKVREPGVMHWVEESQTTTNESGLTVLAAGKREGDLSHDILWWTFFWSVEESLNDPDRGNAWIIDIYIDAVYSSTKEKNSGFSIRCVKNP